MKESELQLQNEVVYLPKSRMYVEKHVSLGFAFAAKSYYYAPTLLQMRLIAEEAEEIGIPLIGDRGEWLADFINYDVKSPIGLDTPNDYILAVHISRPWRVWKERGVWKAVGGIETPVILPPNGWVIPKDGEMYDPKTGFPFKTTMEIDKIKVYKDEFFWRGEKGDGLRIINRECERIIGSSFEISTVQSPDFTHDNIGFRYIFSAQSCLCNDPRGSAHGI